MEALPTLQTQEHEVHRHLHIKSSRTHTNKPTARPRQAPIVIVGKKIPAGTFKKENLNMSIGTFTPKMSIC